MRTGLRIRLLALAITIGGAGSLAPTKALMAAQRDVCSIDQWLDEAQNASDVCASIGCDGASLNQCGTYPDGESWATFQCTYC